MQETQWVRRPILSLKIPKELMLSSLPIIVDWRAFWVEAVWKFIVGNNIYGKRDQLVCITPKYLVRSELESG